MKGDETSAGTTTESRFATYRTARHIKSAQVVNQSLQPHVPPFAPA